MIFYRFANCSIPLEKSSFYIYVNIVSIYVCVCVCYCKVISHITLAMATVIQRPILFLYCFSIQKLECLLFYYMWSEIYIVVIYSEKIALWQWHLVTEFCNNSMQMKTVFSQYLRIKSWYLFVFKNWSTWVWNWI